MKVKDICIFFEKIAPLSFQESYDNSGLLLGEEENSISQALITLDVTEEVIDEAIAKKCDLIISHHPILFSSIKKIGNRHWIDRCIRKAIKNDLNIYAIHTNLDNILSGVNKKIADKIGITDIKILRPKKNTLAKLTVFVPSNEKEHLLDALYEAGAGNIGNYDQCSFQIEGTGTFRPNEDANPTIGKKYIREWIKETRIEVIINKPQISSVLKSMKKAHPYEEVAYYLQDLINENQKIGAGLIGQLPREMKTKDFLLHLKNNMNLKVMRHTEPINKTIKRVALCGGAGSFLLKDAKTQKADVLISSDFKYHDFFEANKEIMIIDIGHYESECFTKNLLLEVLSKNFTNFAFQLSIWNTNPITYYI